MEIATLGGGCFWCTEAIFKEIIGVEAVEAGYAGGHTLNPTYKEVCSDTTGHAEVIRISFDPAQVSYSTLLEVFFKTHDPTTLNRQGNDIGSSYRSVIFYHNEEQKTVAEKVISQLNNEEVYPSAIVTEVTEVNNYFKAENYHQDYYAANGNQQYCAMVVRPKVEKFKKVFADLLK